MSTTLTSKNVEVASGVIIGMPFNYDGTYYYPLVQAVPGETGGLSVYRFFNAGTTNATSIKTTPGMVYGYTVTSVSPEVNYLKFYDKASAPTVGTDTVKFSIGIPIGSTTLQVVSEFWPMGVTFSTGIACAITEDILDSGTTATDTANEMIITIYYK